MSSDETVDPDHVQETLCVGKFSVTTNGQLATITFTHQRAKASSLIERNRVDYENVVRARIVLPIDGLARLVATCSNVLDKSARKEGNVTATSNNKLN